jgi:hypothetical protein
VNRQSAPGQGAVAHERAEGLGQCDVVGRSGDHADRVAGANGPGHDHGEVRAGAADLGEHPHPAAHAHPVGDGPAGDARAGHLEHDLVTDRPAVAGPHRVDVEALEGEVLGEGAVREVAAQVFSPGIALLAGVRVDRLPGPRRGACCSR